jgi:hypothetical protein
MNDAIKSKVGFSHESPAAMSIEWYTPPHIFQSLGLTFDIDVCAPIGGIPWIPAHLSFSKEDDGLMQPWVGLVWCNPPYGKETPLWLKRMHKHRNGVALVFARTDCKWFHDYCAEADAILFLKGRVRFVDGLNISKGSGAGSGSMLVAWGETAVNALFGMHLIGEGRFVDLGVKA